MSELYNKIKKNVLGSKDVDAIKQLDIMEGKTSKTSTFVKRNLAGKIVDKLPGTIGKAVAAGALAATPAITCDNNDEAVVESFDLIIGTQTNKF